MFDPTIIKNLVEDYYHLPPGALDRHTRKREISKPRQLAHYLAYHYKAGILKEIGCKIGRVDHATVLHSFKNVSQGLECDHRGYVYDAKLADDVRALKFLIQRHLDRDMAKWADAIGTY